MTFQATYKTLSDTPLFRPVASALVPLSLSLSAASCAARLRALEGGGGVRNRSESFESPAALKSLPSRAENSASALRVKMLAAESARLALTTPS